MKVRVAGAQLAVTKDVAANVAALEWAVARAADAGADILLTPEGSLSGYTPDFDPAAVAVGLDIITGRAAAAGVGLALGTCFLEAAGDAPGACYNQIRFYAPDGAYLGFHSKQLRCGTLPADSTGVPQGEINDYAAAPLRTFEVGELTAGALICNDLWANPECTPMDDPHLTQQLARMGARVIFHAVNGGRDGGAWSRLAWQYHEANLRMRARAGRLWIVTVDSAYPVDLPCSAPSGVINPEGDWVVRAAPQGEDLFVTTLDVEGA